MISSVNPAHCIYATQNQKENNPSPEKHHKLESRSAMLKSKFDQFQQMTKDMNVHETGKINILRSKRRLLWFNGLIKSHIHKKKPN